MILRIACILLLSAFTSSSAYSQFLNVEGGLQMTTIDGAKYVKTKPRVGFYLGVSRSFQMLRRLWFEPAALYSLQGYSTEYSDTRLHYFLVPMNFRFDIGERFGVMAGPQIGMAVHVVSHYDGGPQFDPVTYVTTPAIRLLNLSAGIGPYYRINDRLSVDLRAVFDLTNIDASTRPGYDLRNAVYRAGVTFMIFSPPDR